MYGALVRHLEQSGYVRTTPFDASFDTGLTINDIDLEKVDDADNGSVQVMLFSDRLEILNPGTLPRGWTADRLLKTHDSKARNLALAQALNWAGFVEKSGNGTEAIVRRCVEAGLPAPEYLPDNVDFKVVIWRNAVRRGGAGAQSGPSWGPVANG